MIIKKLTLYKYKRFFLSNIEKLEIEPTNIIQIILGKNGIGKSSLLSCLTPLPADIKKDYYEDGYKIIEISNNGKEYILTSGGDLGNKHSFLCDGVELNASGIKTVQLGLVDEHFKITMYSSNIVNGVNKFTTMGINERKNLFQNISFVDYSYPLRFFNNLKIRHRDITGGIKTIQDAIIKTKVNIIEEKDIATTQETLENLKTYIDHVISLYNHNVYNNDTVDSIDNKLETINNEMNSILSKLGTETKETILENNMKLLLNINSNKIRINTIKEALSKIDNKINRSEEELEKEIKENETLLLNHKITIDGLDFKDIILITDNFLSIKEDLFNCLDDLNNYNGVYTKEINYKDTKEKFINVSNKKDMYNKHLDEIDHELKHITTLKTDDNKVECPVCNHNWFNNYDSSREVKLLESKNSLIEKLEVVNKEYKTLLEQTTKMEEKNAIIQNIVNIIKYNSNLKPIWIDVLKDNSLLYTNGGVLINIFSSIEQNLKYWKEERKLFDRNLELKSNLSIIKEANKIIKETMNMDIDSLEEEYSNLVNSTIELESKLSFNKKEIERIDKLIHCKNELLNLLKKRKFAINDTVEQERNKYIKIYTNELKMSMVELEQKLTLNNQYISKVESDIKTIEDLTNREQVVKVMIKELSPSEGLIAKSINSFLNKFITDMNNVINSIWEYDIEILPCIVNDENDLDYRFPVRVNGDQVMEDVSKLSSSMMEIVDLAFRLVYIKYNRFEDMPLILDEFARTFDKIHSNKAYDIIDNVFVNDFKQIFIVSHFESMYGRFINSEITILGDRDMYEKDIVK